MDEKQAVGEADSPLEERAIYHAMARAGIPGWHPVYPRKPNGALQDRDFQWLCTMVYQGVRGAIGSMDQHIEAAPTDDAIRQLWFATATGVAMVFGVVDEMLRRLSIPRVVRERVLANAMRGGASLVGDSVPDPGLAPTRPSASKRPLSLARVPRRGRLRGRRQRRG